MTKPKKDTERDEMLAALDKTKGNVTELARQLRQSRRTLGDRLVKLGINPAEIKAKYETHGVDLSMVSGGKLDAKDEAIIQALTKAKSVTLLELCDIVQMPPSPVLEAIHRLHSNGYRIPSHEEVMRHGTVSLKHKDNDPYTESNEEYDLDFEGDTYITATISDPHLCSIHDNIAYLECAYDMIEKLGIKDVYHGGDNTCGMGIYPGQINEVKHVSLDQQKEYAIRHYPKRAGIRTKGIAGNHDIEGVAGRIGVNPFKSFCAERDDFDYLGEYSVFLNLPNGARVQMLHPMSGMSYAISYKLQKHIETYDEAEKPDILWCGHYHKSFYLPGIRNMHAFLLGTFEGQSTLAKRKALGQPALGFWIHKITMKPRGVVQYQPTWMDFLHGAPDFMEVA